MSATIHLLTGGSPSPATRSVEGSAPLNRSALFTVYNVARGMVADTGRLNRGLGLAMRKQPRPYVTTATSCTCKDFTFRSREYGFKCKHQLAMHLVEAAS